MHAALVVVGLLAACRFHFDERTDARPSSDGEASDAIDIGDALASHDEDGDGVFDHVDTCPHAPVSQLDSDKDGVGDACDPEPSLPRQRFVLFDPMLANAWTVITATWAPQGDSLYCDATTQFGELSRAVPFVRGTYVVGFDILTRAAAATQYQVSISVYDQLTLPFYYVEAYDPAGPGYAALSRYTGTTFTPVVQRALPNGVEVGRVDLVFHAPASPTLAFEAVVGGTQYAGMANVSGYPGGANIGIGGQGITFAVRYAVVIESF